MADTPATCPQCGQDLGEDETKCDLCGWTQPETDDEPPQG
jgi:uncharacterized membrane protein YvbJ